MQSAKQKVSDMASAAKEKIQVGKAKVEEEAAQAAARSKEVRKVKEAEAEADLHGAKAKHTAEKLEAKQTGHHYHIPGTGIGTGTNIGHETYGGAPASSVVGMGHGQHHHVPGTGGHQLGGATGGTIPGINNTNNANFEGYLPHYKKHI